ncbi:hypothetical protein D2Q93_07110 [Alicyclobacillaceae bacterium I2511]|nr:hypothetical protein D2Q93_07110 [Alicyclobacillaceae bacterium I2511]
MWLQFTNSRNGTDTPSIPVQDKIFPFQGNDVQGRLQVYPVACRLKPIRQGGWAIAPLTMGELL